MTALATFAHRGPFDVGVQTITVASTDGRDLPVWVWYPVASIEGCEKAIHVMGQHVPHDAYEDAPPRPGPLPLILFSHGNGGIAQQSTFLTTHLASWGFVVAAPDHVGNTFSEHFGVTDEFELRRIHREALRNRPHDMVAVLDVLTGKKAPLADTSNVALPTCAVPAIGITGHSFGGWTTIKTASQIAVRAAVPLAPAEESFIGRKAYVDALPQKLPMLMIVGKLDSLIQYETQALPLAKRMDAALAHFVIMPRADHRHFCDNVEMLHEELRQRAPQALPYNQLLSQERSHRILAALVTAFFHAVHEASTISEDPVHTMARLAPLFTPENVAQLDEGAVVLVPAAKL